jgi:hypothetical protein
LLFYYNGNRLEEYVGDHTTKDIAEYLLAKMNYLEELEQKNAPTRDKDEL